MIPRSPQEIRDWVERMGLSQEAAARALALGNADKVMREYCSDARHPAQTTRSHMDLLEQARDALAFLEAGQTNRARNVLEAALAARLPARNNGMII